MQPEPTPTQKSARKWQLRPFATSCVKDYKVHSLLQTSFAELPSAVRKRGLFSQPTKLRGVGWGGGLKSTLGYFIVPVQIMKYGRSILQRHASPWFYLVIHHGSAR